MPDWDNPDNNLWKRDEEFRQTVIRQAILLGFSGTQEEQIKPGPIRWWAFELDGRKYTGYSSCYSAALEYLRLIGAPFSTIGVVRVSGR